MTGRSSRLGATFEYTDTVQLFNGETAITLLFNFNTGILVTLKNNSKSDRIQQIVGKPDDKNPSVLHTFSFLASQRKACNVLEIKSYYRIIVDDKSITLQVNHHISHFLKAVLGSKC